MEVQVDTRALSLSECLHSLVLMFSTHFLHRANFSLPPNAAGSSGKNLDFGGRILACTAPHTFFPPSLNPSCLVSVRFCNTLPTSLTGLPTGYSLKMATAGYSLKKK